MSDLTYPELLERHAKRVAAFRPLGDQVLLELEAEHAHYSGSLIIPDNAAADEMGVRFARVVAAGPGRYVANGHVRCPMSVRVGDRVVIDQILTRGPFPCIAPGFHVGHDQQILAVVEP